MQCINVLFLIMDVTHALQLFAGLVDGHGRIDMQLTWHQLKRDIQATTYCWQSMAQAADICIPPGMPALPSVRGSAHSPESAAIQMHRHREPRWSPPGRSVPYSPAIHPLAAREHWKLTAWQQLPEPTHVRAQVMRVS